MRDRNPPLVVPDPEHVRTATVVLDTNVLLGLYRLTGTARDDALSVLELPALQDRLWLPNQVVIEFYRNLPRVRGRVAEAYRKVGVDLRSAAGAAKTAFARESRSKEANAEVAKLIDDGVDALAEALGDLAAKHQALVPDSADPVLERIERIFDQRTGAEPDEQTVRGRVEEFQTWRAPNQIPPGYEDVPTKHTPVLRAGDYLLWCELLDKAAETRTPFLFVTDDVKTDWWTGDAPRPELVREFGRHNDAAYHQVTFEVFLADAREHLGAEVSDETVEEVAAEREAVATAGEARWLMESWANRTRENREWAQRGFMPIDSSIGRAAAQFNAAIVENPELLSALQRAVIHNPELISALQRAAVVHDPERLGALQSAAAVSSAAAQSILALASAGSYPDFPIASQGTSADTSMLRSAANAASEAVRDPALRRARADVDSPAAQSSLRAARPPGQARRPVKAGSDQKRESDPAAPQSEPVMPPADRPDSD